MSEEKTIMEVVVNKASIQLASGETLEQYTQKLADSGKEHVMRKLNLTEKSGGAWMVEVFPSSAIFRAYKNDGKGSFYSVEYKRDKEGNFTFDKMIEVERITSFKPKGGITVTKNDEEWIEKLIQKSVGNFEYVQKPFPNEHAARQTDPKQYDTFRRVHPEGFPKGVDVIYGIKTKPKRVSEIQTIRFDAKLWTVEKAKTWLKEHNFKTTVEAAAKPKREIKKRFGDWVQTEKDFWSGVL